MEQHVRSTPAGMRDELRRAMREMLENDPSIAPVVEKLRAAKR